MTPVTTGNSLPQEWQRYALWVKAYEIASLRLKNAQAAEPLFAEECGFIVNRRYGEGNERAL